MGLRLRMALLLALASALEARAQGWEQLSRADVVENAELRSQASIALFVDGTSGNDSGTCLGTGGAACATIQGAINKLPETMWGGPALITVAAGNYAGFYVDSLRGRNGLQATGTYVQIDGTRITATPTTGSATGTATAGSAGSGVTDGTLTDSGASWTTNDFVGKLVEVNGAWRVIRSNTATVITVTGTWSSPAGLAYTIQDWGTVLNTAVNTPAQNSFTAATSSTSAAIMIGDVGRGEARVTFRWLKMTTARSVRMDTSARVLFQECRFEPTASAITINRGSLITTRDSFSIPNSGFGILPGANAAIDIASTSSLWRGGTGTALLTNTPLYAQFVGDAFDNLTSGVLVGSTGQVVLSNVKFGTVSGNCVGFDGASTSAHHQSNAHILVDTSSFTSCGVAISARGGGKVSTSTLTGSSNTLIYRVYQGGWVSESSASTIAGTTEIDVDGATSTIAALRGASPKAVVNANTFSKIWEP